MEELIKRKNSLIEERTKKLEAPNLTVKRRLQIEKKYNMDLLALSDEFTEIKFKSIEDKISELEAKKQELSLNVELNDDEKKAEEEKVNEELDELAKELIAYAREAKEKLQNSIKSLKEKMQECETRIAEAKKEIERRNAEIEEELKKETPNEAAINAKRVQIEGLNDEIKYLEGKLEQYPAIIKEEKKRLIPLMKNFRDIFDGTEIEELEKLDEKIEQGKKLSEKNKEKKAEQEQGAEDKANKEEKTKNTGKSSQSSTDVVVNDEEGEENDTPEEKAEEAKSLKDEFNELYIKAKKGSLEKDDFYRLAEIMSDPENYAKCEITTGVLDNKAKVVLKAMGKYATKNEKQLVDNAKNYFGIEKIEGEDFLLDTKKAAKWSGIKKLSKNKFMNTKSYAICDKVKCEAVTKNIDDLSKEQKSTLEQAEIHCDMMDKFGISIAIYAEVKKERNNRMFSLSKETKDVKGLVGSGEENKQPTILDELGVLTEDNAIYPDDKGVGEKSTDERNR